MCYPVPSQFQECLVLKHMVNMVIHIYFNFLLVINHRAVVITSKHLLPLIPYFIGVVVEYVMASVEVDGSESWS
jgi:hypothetical protein